MPPNQDALQREEQLRHIHEHTSKEVKNVLSPQKRLLKHSMFLGYAKEIAEWDKIDCESVIVQLQVSALSVTKRENNHSDQHLEYESWKLTIDTLKRLIQKAGLTDQIIILEYCFPCADVHAEPPRADIVVLGKNRQSKNRIFIIEMKGWENNIIAEHKLGCDLIKVHLGGKEIRTKHPCGQALYYMQNLQKLQETFLPANERITIEAAGYLPNIKKWPSDRAVHTALFNSRSIQYVKLYTGITEHNLVSKLQECVGNGSGNDALRTMEKLSERRRDIVGL